MKVTDSSRLVVGHMYAARVEETWYRCIVRSAPGSPAKLSTSVSVNAFSFCAPMFDVSMIHYISQFSFGV